jgi:hypothetical protein
MWPYEENLRAGQIYGGEEWEGKACMCVILRGELPNARDFFELQVTQPISSSLSRATFKFLFSAHSHTNDNDTHQQLDAVRCHAPSPYPAEPSACSPGGRDKPRSSRAHSY